MTCVYVIINKTIIKCIKRKIEKYKYKIHIMYNNCTYFENYVVTTLTVWENSMVAIVL